MIKARLLHFKIQPVIVHDDGEQLSDGPEIAGVAVREDEIAGYVTKFRAELAEYETRLNADDEG